MSSLQLLLPSRGFSRFLHRFPHEPPAFRLSPHILHRPLRLDRCPIIEKACYSSQTCIDPVYKQKYCMILHHAVQIETCDGILAGMEAMLGRFQGDLGNISSEIRQLQEQSQSMSVRLKNRKAAEQKLGAFLDNLAVPAGLIEGIVQREVDDDYQVLFLVM